MTERFAYSFKSEVLEKTVAWFAFCVRRTQSKTFLAIGGILGPISVQAP